MSKQVCALTFKGPVIVETAIPLEQLKLGDTVLGSPDGNDPGEPRTTHVITAVLGKYHVPTEDPTLIERGLIAVGLERVVAGERVDGILVQGAYGPGMFTLDTTPTLDRVIP